MIGEAEAMGEVGEARRWAASVQMWADASQLHDGGPRRRKEGIGEARAVNAHNDGGGREEARLWQEE